MFIAKGRRFGGAGFLLCTIAAVGCSVSMTLLAAESGDEANRAEATGGVAELDPVQVDGAEVDAWAPLEGYYAYDARTATKTDTPIIETPQSISVITRDRIEEQGALTLQDALGYSAGIRSDAYGLDSRGDWALVRGVQFTQYLDGLRMLFDNYNNIRPEPFALERIEILRGPSSVLYGQSAVGGIVNLVSKRPTAEPRREIQVQLGNHNRKQLGLDFSGPLTEDGDWLYRIVALGRDSDTQVDFVENNRLLFAPSLTWRPGEDTEWTFLANVQRDYSGSTTAFLPWSGTLLPNPNGQIPTSRFVSEPGFDRYDTEQAALGWNFEHQANETWTLRQNLRYTNSSADYRTLYPNVYTSPEDPFVPGTNQRAVQRYIYISQPDAYAWTLDNQAQAEWGFGITEHTFLFGLDYSDVRIDGRQGMALETTPFDLFSPVYGNFTIPPVAETPESNSYQAGLYFQDQIKIARKWVVTGGVRHDWTGTDVDGGDNFSDTATTWRLGAVYLADNGLAPYVSYTESFLPINRTDFFSQPYEPKRGEQYEIGIRYQPPGTRSRITASVYDLTEENQLAPDPANPFNEIQLGSTSVQGFEFESILGIGYDFDLIATYSYTDSETDGGPAGTKGVLPGVPEHMASVWATYRLNGIGLPGFTLGTGVRFIGETTDETETLRVPSETLLDAMVAYEKGPWRLAVNGINVTDEEYLTTCLSRGDCFYGSRATVISTLSYRF